MHRSVVTCLLAASIVFLPSCASGPGVLGATLSDSSVELVRGESAAITVTVSATGTGPASLSVGGLPANVSASFDPPSLDGGATTSTLTLTAAPAAAEGDATLIVTATRGGSAATAELGLTVTSLTVQGTLLGLFGEGLGGIDVAIGSATTTSASDGTFTIPGLAVPYDLVVYTPGADGHAHVFRELTTATPEVLPYAALLDDDYRTATVEGTLPAVVPASSSVSVCVEGVSTSVRGCTTVTEGAATYTLTANWVGGASVDVRVHALLASVDADDLPTGYLGYATVPDSLEDGLVETIDIPSPTLTPAATTIGVAASLPGGYTIREVALSAAIDAAFALPFAYAGGPIGSSFSVAAPVIGEGRYDLVVAASAADDSVILAWRSGLEGGATVALTLPTPAVPVSPPDGTVGVTTLTTFAVASGSGVAKTFLFSPDGVVGPTFLVTTTSDSVGIPSVAGLSLPATTAYSWQVFSAQTASTMDEALYGWIGHYSDAVSSTTSSGPATDADGAITVSPPRTFTTN